MAGTDQDLAGLPGPLADALRRTDVTVEMFDTLVTVNRDDYDIIRAELLRLVDENETLERAASKHVLRCTELQAILGTVLPKECAASGRAEKSEAELAALKARIAEAPIVMPLYAGNIHSDVPMTLVVTAPVASEWRGKRVRLVVEE